VKVGTPVTAAPGKVYTDFGFTFFNFRVRNFTGQTDRQTERQTDKRTDGRTDGKDP